MHIMILIMVQYNYNTLCMVYTIQWLGPLKQINSNHYIAHTDNFSKTFYNHNKLRKLTQLLLLVKIGNSYQSIVNGKM